MKNTLLIEVLGNTPTIKLLSFFLGHPQLDYSKNELAKTIDQSRQTVYKAIIPLIDFDLITKSRRIGHTQLYKLNQGSDQVNAIERFNRLIVDQVVDNEMGFTPKLEGTPNEFLRPLQQG